MIYHPQSGGLLIGVHVRQRHPRLDEQRRDRAVIVWRIIDPFALCAKRIRLLSRVM